MSKAQAALSGMGQSNVTATPLQMAMVSAALANGGKLVAPHVVSRVTDGDGKVLRDGAKPTTTQVVSADTAGQLRTAMADVVARGAGSAARIDGAELGGKPATARGGAGGAETQLVHLVRPARRRGKQMAVAVVVADQGASGSADGGPGARIAKRIMQAAIG
ncbi:penicillin-binding transpeptidase domain-containing protein [Streptomyces sp. NPDC005355]|uniref:penicillin-binding transpeptidase domain-containing protein n=1 Tax=Streptomyces sp. NPDC005355 TaxID=3157038 RepID=UPI0033A8B581